MSGLPTDNTESLCCCGVSSQRKTLYYANTVHIMYYRINTISFDASRKDEFMAYADSMRSEMKNITGVQSICIIETSEGQATGVAIYDSKASAEDALPQIQKIMGGMKEFFTAPPDLKLGPVMWSM